MSMTDNIYATVMPDAPATLIRRLNAAGFEAYAVGGCVRDTLLGLTPDDWDITTAALPQETAKVFADCRVIETGLQHGTITVRLRGKNYEITTYRVDGEYTDNRHPDSVSFTPSVFEDVKRRDFTVNAMLWHPDDGIRDLVGGVDDLNTRTLRCVGEPVKRFSEDALRILRALRFAAVYGFDIHPDTKAAAALLADNLQAVSVERIRVELFKLLCGEYAAEILTAFPSIVKVILPEITLADKQLKTLSLTPKETVYRLAVLLQGADETAVLRRLKADNATITQVSALRRAATISPATDTILLKKLLHLYSPKALQQAIVLCLAQAQAEGGLIDDWNEMRAALERLLATDPCYSLEKLQIGGKELMALGFKGKQIGEMLDSLLTAVIEERCDNQTDALLTLAKQHI